MSTDVWLVEPVVTLVGTTDNKYQPTSTTTKGGHSSIYHLVLAMKKLNKAIEIKIHLRVIVFTKLLFNEQPCKKLTHPSKHENERPIKKLYMQNEQLSFEFVLQCE